MLPLLDQGGKIDSINSLSEKITSTHPKLQISKLVFIFVAFTVRKHTYNLKESFQLDTRRNIFLTKAVAQAVQTAWFSVFPWRFFRTKSTKP